MKSDKPTPDVGHSEPEQAFEGTVAGETTTDEFDKAFGRLKDQPPVKYMDEPGCSRLLEVLRSHPPEELTQVRASESRVGEKIDEYRLERLLGRGGMGEVYYAQHARLGRGFAVKVLHPHRRNDDQLVSRFEREMKAIGQLDHENIVRATGAGQIGDDLFLVMEYVEGQPLSVVLKNAPDARLLVTEACRLIHQTCAGLQYVHDRGMVHRDIKPANLMLDKTGRIRILDLGLARVTSPGHFDEELTRERQTMGTVDFMAPEQIRDSRQVDHRADMYALGVTFYKLLTGRTPFGDEQHPTAESRLLAIANKDAPSLRELRDDIPVELADLIQRMLSRDPAERPQSMRAVAHEIEQFQLAEAEQHTEQRLAPEVAGRKGGRGGRRWVAAALVFLALGAAAKLVIRLQTGGRGELFITAADDVEITIRNSAGEEQAIQLTAGQNRPIEVKAGKFEIVFDGAGVDQFQWSSDRKELVMKRGDAFRASIVRRSSKEIEPTAANRSSGPSPLDSLSRETIDPDELAVAGGGDPTNAARELVSICGDSRWKNGSGIGHLSYLDDGARIFSVGAICAVWDVATGRIVQRFSGNRIGAIGAQGKYVATTDWGDDLVQVWDATSGKKLDKLGADGMTPVFLHVDDARGILVSVIRTGEVEFWDLATGRLIREALHHGSQIVFAAVSADGKRLATAGEDETVRVWDLHDGTVTHSVKDAGRLTAVELSANGQLLFCGGRGVLDRYELGKEVRRTRLSEEPWEWKRLKVDSSGVRLAAASAGVQVFDVETGRVLASWLDPAGQDVLGIAFHPDGDLLATGGACTIQFRDSRTGELRGTQAKRYGVASAVDLSPDGSTLATGFQDSVIELYDVRTGKRQQVLAASESHVSAIAFSVDSRMLAASYGSGKVIFWNVATGDLVEEWRAHEGPAFALVRSPDGQTLATCGHDGIRLWDSSTRQLRLNIPSDYPGVEHLVYSPDGAELICREGNSIRVRDAESGDVLRQSTAVAAQWREVAISPDGRAIAASQLVDSRTLKGISGALSPMVRSNTFAHDQALLSAANGDVEVWSRVPARQADAPPGYLRRRKISVSPDGGIISKVIVSPDGRHFITANGNGTTSVVRLRPQVR